MGKREEPLDLGPVSRAEPATDAQVYGVHWEKHHCWAYVSVHEATGCVAVHSDHGDWSYRWNLRGLGKATLHAFLADAGTDYVLGKLVPAERRECVDERATIDSWREAIAVARRAREIDANTAHEAWLAALEWDGGDAIPSEVEEAIGASWEDVCMCETGEARAFRSIWPELRKLIAAACGKVASDGQ